MVLAARQRRRVGCDRRGGLPAGQGADVRKARRPLSYWLIAGAVVIAALVLLYCVAPLIFWAPMIVLACAVAHSCV